MRNTKYARMIILLFVCLLTAGCSGAKTILTKMQKAYSAQENIRLELSMVVSDGDVSAPYRLEQVQTAAGARFTILEPEIIGGITAEMTAAGLTFAGAHVAVQTMPVGYTPFDLAYFAIETLKDTHFTTVGRERLGDTDAFIIEKNVQVYEKNLRVNLWLNAETYQLMKYEFFDDGSRVLEANVAAFEVQAD